MLIQEWNHSWKKTHLGAAIGSTKYRDEYVKDLVKNWDNQLTILSIIAETQLLAACLAFATGFKRKLNYFLRTIPNILNLLLPIERNIWSKFIPAVTGSYICNDKERVLISLPTRYGGLAIPIFHETAEIEFMNSIKILSELTINDIIEDNLTQNWDKKVNRRKIQKIHRKNKNRNEWQRKMSGGYINTNWSSKLVDSTSNYRI